FGIWVPNTIMWDHGIYWGYQHTPANYLGMGDGPAVIYPLLPYTTCDTRSSWTLQLHVYWWDLLLLNIPMPFPHKIPIPILVGTILLSWDPPHPPPTRALGFWVRGLVLLGTMGTFVGSMAQAPYWVLAISFVVLAREIICDPFLKPNILDTWYPTTGWGQGPFLQWIHTRLVWVVAKYPYWGFKPKYSASLIALVDQPPPPYYCTSVHKSPYTAQIGIWFGTQNPLSKHLEVPKSDVLKYYDSFTFMAFCYPTLHISYYPLYLSYTHGLTANYLGPIYAIQLYKLRNLCIREPFYLYSSNWPAIPNTNQSLSTATTLHKYGDSIAENHGLSPAFTGDPLATPPIVPHITIRILPRALTNTLTLPYDSHIAIPIHMRYEGYVLDPFSSYPLFTYIATNARYTGTRAILNGSNPPIKYQSLTRTSTNHTIVNGKFMTWAGVMGDTTCGIRFEPCLGDGWDTHGVWGACGLGYLGFE
ncbi:hypothetical protein G9A89_000503, partial [Geosiphon pyriformis]